MIYRANTSEYNYSHFNTLDVSAPKGVMNHCYDNIVLYAKHYTKLGRDVSIVLVLGGKGLNGDNGVTYHFLLEDNVTGEYIDPQLDTFTFILVHKWTFAEYKQERAKFKKLRNSDFTGHIFLWYVAEDYDYLYSGLMLIQSIVQDKLTKKEVKQYMKYMKSNIMYGYSPKFGECLIPSIAWW